MYIESGVIRYPNVPAYSLHNTYITLCETLTKSNFNSEPVHIRKTNLSNIKNLLYYKTCTSNMCNILNARWTK